MVSVINIQFTSMATPIIPDFITGEGEYTHYHFLDTDECQADPCDVNANCTNSDGSYACTCNVGYEGNGTNCTGIYHILVPFSGW